MKLLTKPLKELKPCKNHYLFFLAIAVFLIAGCQDEFETDFPEKGTIKGYIEVYDKFGAAKNTAHTEGFQVTINGKSAITNADGFYSIGGLNTGTVQITVSKPGYATLNTDYQFRGESELLNLMIAEEVDTEIDTFWVEPIYPFEVTTDTIRFADTTKPDSVVFDTTYANVAYAKFNFTVKQRGDRVNDRFIRIYWGDQSVDYNNFTQSLKTAVFKFYSTTDSIASLTTQGTLNLSFPVGQTQYFVAYPVHPFDSRRVESGLQNKPYFNMRTDLPTQTQQVFFQDK